MRRTKGSRFLTEVETIMGKRYLEWRVLKVLPNNSYLAEIIGANHIKKTIKESEIYRWEKGGQPELWK